MSVPLISICIPTYNGQEFLETCLDSAIKQSFHDIEIIIVDDCSTDSTWDIATQYAARDKRVKLFRNEKNLGLVGNWNRCIEVSKGEWVKFLFQDDCLAENCIEKMMAVISPTDKMVASKRSFIFDNTVSSSTKNYYENKVRTFENTGIRSTSPVFIEAKQVSTMTIQNICLNFIGEPTFILFKRDVIAEVGVFNQDLIQICDLEYFLRIATRFGIRYIPESLSYFRIHSKSTSASNISDKLFVLNHLDTIITTHQLLFDTLFSKFRDALSFFQKAKLKAFFSVRVYESYKNSLNTTSENRAKFETIERKYSAIARFKSGTLSARILLTIARFKRALRKAG